jgi:endonuclease/exonuclease/phosphatase family metal-dependent hydrolase
MATALLAVLLVCAGAETREVPNDERGPSTPLLNANGFTELRPATSAGPAPGDPLCAEAEAPDAATFKVHIHCAVETGDFVPRAERADFPPAASSESGPFRLSVLVWNLERGVEAPRQLEMLRGGPGLRSPDLLLLSELDRGCWRSGYRNVARDLAQGLGLSYVFGVEFVELPRPWGPGGFLDTVCEHGNAILSRFPLDHVSLLRFASNRSWYEPPVEQRAGGGEPRLGGRMALGADVHLGSRVIRAYSFHLESRPVDAAYREAQARELVAAAGERGAVLLGGDANAHWLAADLVLGTKRDTTAAALFSSGFRDAHRGLPLARRVTHPPLLVIDLIAGRDVVFEGPSVGTSERFGGLSDHLPLWTSVRLDE